MMIYRENFVFVPYHYAGIDKDAIYFVIHSMTTIVTPISMYCNYMFTKTVIELIISLGLHLIMYLYNHDNSSNLFKMI